MLETVQRPLVIDSNRAHDQRCAHKPAQRQGKIMGRKKRGNIGGETGETIGNNEGEMGK